MTPPVPDLEIQAAARLLADGSPGEAARILERLVQAAPAYAAGLVLLARAYDGDGRSGDALEAWHRAHFLVPTSPLVRRERQRLLDAGVPGRDATSVASIHVEPPPLPAQDEAPLAEDDLLAEALLAEAAAAPSDPVEDVDAAPEGDPGWADSDDQPFEPLWADEPEADEAQPLGEPEGNNGDEAPEPAFRDGPATIEDAPGVDVSGPEPAMDAFDWTVSTPADRPPVLPRPEETAGEPARLFAEDAFAGETAFEAETVFARVSVPVTDDAVGDDEGWTLLDETDDRAPVTTGPQEAGIAPPVGFEFSSYWSVVPAHGPAEEEPIDEPEARETGYADAAPTAGPSADDLDTLIEQIENAPRIRPDPDFVAPLASEDPPDDDEDVVSETLARIYAAQAQYSEAAAVYEKLALQRPDSAVEFRRRAAELRQRAGER